MKASTITVLDQFTYPEMIQALRVIGPLREPTISAWIQRGNAYGIPKKGPGSGGRRTYSALGILSLALMHRLTQYGLEPRMVAQMTIPGIWRSIAAAPGPVDYIWLVKSHDKYGPILTVIISNSDKPELEDKSPIIEKYDLAEDVEKVLVVLARLKAERPTDSILPRAECVPATPQTAYGFYHAGAS